MFYIANVLSNQRNERRKNKFTNFKRTCTVAKRTVEYDFFEPANSYGDYDKYLYDHDAETSMGDIKVGGVYFNELLSW